MSEEHAPYIVTPTLPATIMHTRLERARERLWRRVMQAKREGARFVVVDLSTLTLSVAQKVEHFGQDDNGEILIDEAHE